MLRLDLNRPLSVFPNFRICSIKPPRSFISGANNRNLIQGSVLARGMLLVA